MMNFDIPEHLAQYLQELDDFIETQILPLQMQDDNNRFFDHRREDARTDWERDGLPNEQWEALLLEAKRRADAAGHFRFLLAQSSTAAGMAATWTWRSSANILRRRDWACTTTCRTNTPSSATMSACC